MDWFVILITGTLSFTLPSHEGAGCGEANAPLTDLSTALLYRQAQGSFPRLIKIHNVAGMEGQPYSFTFDAGDSVVGYYVTTRDFAGNESCPSAIVQIGGVTGVPFEPRGIQSRKLYDVSGRREPRAIYDRFLGRWRCPECRPGVYFERSDAARAGRLVLLR